MFDFNIPGRYKLKLKNQMFPQITKLFLLKKDYFMCFVV